MDMKKILMTMAMLLVLGTGLQAVAQNHRHTPRTQEELVDTTRQGAVEVFSDTTTVADTATVTYADEWDDETDDVFSVGIDRMVDSMSGRDLFRLLAVLGIVFFVFVLAPVLIIVAIFYFVNKNRKQKMRLAEMAMQQGQPIPEHLLEDKVNTVSDEYQKGLRQCFVGIGLMIFLGLTAEEVGFGIGALVFCIGLGKIVAAKMAERKQ